MTKNTKRKKEKKGKNKNGKFPCIILCESFLFYAQLCIGRYVLQHNKVFTNNLIALTYM